MPRATIGVRDLRDGLSGYLAAVRNGAEITVTNRGRPFARITPIGAETGLEALLRERIAKAPAAPRRPLPARIVTAGTVSDLVADQRT